MYNYIYCAHTTSTTCTNTIDNTANLFIYCSSLCYNTLSSITALSVPRTGAISYKMFPYLLCSGSSTCYNTLNANVDEFKIYCDATYCENTYTASTYTAL